MSISSKKIKYYTYLLYFLICLLLIGLLVIPESPIIPIINGAKSQYTPGPISIQSSEPMKVTLILALARVVSRRNQFTFNKSFQSDLLLFSKIIGASLVPSTLTLLQNDLGTTLVLAATIAGVMLVSGVTWHILAPTFITGTVGVMIVILGILYTLALIENLLGVQLYQMGRINSQFDPYTYNNGDGYHLTEPLKAIGPGQLLGEGYSHGEVYIPENHIDFIFSVIGEELGFIGFVILILIFLFLIFHLVRLAAKTGDQFNKIFIAGFITLFAFHILQNIGITIQLLPIIDIPLLFISYGGSALWSMMTEIGIVLSTYYHEPKRYVNLYHPKSN